MNECAVCLQPFGGGEPHAVAEGRLDLDALPDGDIRLRCNHVFHSACVEHYCNHPAVFRAEDGFHTGACPDCHDHFPISEPHPVQLWPKFSVGADWRVGCLLAAATSIGFCILAWQAIHRTYGIPAKVAFVQKYQLEWLAANAHIPEAMSRFYGMERWFGLAALPASALLGAMQIAIWNTREPTHSRAHLRMIACVTSIALTVGLVISQTRWLNSFQFAPFGSDRWVLYKYVELSLRAGCLVGATLAHYRLWRRPPARVWPGIDADARLAIVGAHALPVMFATVYLLILPIARLLNVKLFNANFGPTSLKEWFPALIAAPPLSLGFVSGSAIVFHLWISPRIALESNLR